MLLQLIIPAALAFFFYGLTIAIYRAYCSPLSKIPGPKLAAMTQCYEMYYDLIKKARFPWQIQKLHDLYGMSYSVSMINKDSNNGRTDHSNISMRSPYQ